AGRFWLLVMVHVLLLPSVNRTLRRSLAALLVRQGRLGVGPRDDAYQPAFQRGHQAVGLNVVVTHRLQQLLERHARAERLWPGPHHRLGGRLRITVELRFAQQAKHHPLGTDDHAGLGTGRMHSRTDRTDALRQTACGPLGLGDVADPDLVDRLALPRLVFLVPGLFARDVVD